MKTYSTRILSGNLWDHTREVSVPTVMMSSLRKGPKPPSPLSAVTASVSSVGAAI